MCEISIRRKKKPPNPCVAAGMVSGQQRCRRIRRPTAQGRLRSSAQGLRLLQRSTGPFADRSLCPPCAFPIYDLRVCTCSFHDHHVCAFLSHDLHVCLCRCHDPNETGHFMLLVAENPVFFAFFRHDPNKTVHFIGVVAFLSLTACLFKCSTACRNSG